MTFEGRSPVLIGIGIVSSVAVAFAETFLLRLLLALFPICLFALSGSTEAKPPPSTTTRSPPNLPRSSSPVETKAVTAPNNDHPEPTLQSLPRDDVVVTTTRQLQPTPSPRQAIPAYIPGTMVRRDSPLSPNPLDPVLQYPRQRSGINYACPQAVFVHFKHNRNGEARVRFVKPGKLTPYILSATPEEQGSSNFKASEHIRGPYRETGSKLAPVSKQPRTYRHIASFSLRELRQLGWDGAMCNSKTLDGDWVPFVCGYDSDPEDTYEPFDVEKAREEGIVGLPEDEEGCFADMPSRGIVQLRSPKQARQMVQHAMS